MYWSKIEKEMRDFCEHVIKMIISYILPIVNDLHSYELQSEELAFYYKMIADFYWYILESLRLKDKDLTLLENTNSYYEKAKQVSDEL